MLIGAFQRAGRLTASSTHSQGRHGCPRQVIAHQPPRSRCRHICQVSATTTTTTQLFNSPPPTSTSQNFTYSARIQELCADWNEANRATNDWRRQQEATEALKATAAAWSALVQVQLRQTWAQDNSRPRSDSIEGLAVLLWQAYSLDDETFLKERLALLRQVQSLLSAGEQIFLFERLPGSVRLTPEELYEFAKAYLAEGYRMRSSSAIDTAERLFMSAIQVAEASKTVWWGWGLPAPVVNKAYLARATCNILLNRIALAERLMEQGGQRMAQVDNALFRSEADVALYMMAERIMNDEVLPMFTEYKDYRAELEKWVDGRTYPLTYTKKGTPPRYPTWNEPPPSNGLGSVDEALRSIDEVSNAVINGVSRLWAAVRK